MTSASLIPIRYSDLVGWEVDDHAAAFNAFLPGARRMVSKPYKTRGLNVSGKALADVAELALSTSVMMGEDARRFFEDNFVPHKVVPMDGTNGFLTGFFEPVVEARLQRSKRFCHPLYRRPPELIDVDDGNRPASMPAHYRFATVIDGTIQPYLDRAAIQAGALEGRGLELVWLEDPVDVFFIHVQGAAKLKLEDGRFLRVTYAAKAGHIYTSVAKVLCERKGIDPSEMTADRLADWMRNHRDQLDELLAHNRSYIFFKTVDDLDANLGPIAAAKIPLISGRSMAVDRTLHTFGCPIWLSTKKPLPASEKPLQRLMMAHDTGSAIVGPARGDIFTGSGDVAGRVAGRVRHEMDMVVLVPTPQKQATR